MTEAAMKAPVAAAIESGIRNHDQGLDGFGLEGLKAVYWNLEAPQLYEHAIRNGEARIAAGGALVVETGQHTGRSALDKFVVRDALTENTVWWDNNKAMEPRQGTFRVHPSRRR